MRQEVHNFWDGDNHEIDKDDDSLSGANEEKVSDEIILQCLVVMSQLQKVHP